MSLQGAALQCSLRAAPSGHNVMALVEASPKGYHLISQFNLPGGLGTGWQHPVVLDGRLYIRGQDQLLCYDVKAQ